MKATTSNAIEQKPIGDFSEQAYLDYAMYVILDRALPHIADGLKPVQRRIIYAMSELGLKSSAKFKKSARTVGDVLGKYHPHGDTACYEAMVLMAQHFSYRYPLIDGQGNWGSADDPKSFAAMRYTESRLCPYAEALLSELQQGTVDWVANFDSSLEEPALLPARLPNVLLNGSTGIAVGMSTDIPPHHLSEIIEACIYLLDHPNATLEDITAIVPAPDYPTGAEIITPRQEIIKLYQSGQGSLRLRAVYHRENANIVITALPYQVSGAKILEQIASQMLAKKLPSVSDLLDESDHEHPTRLIITPRSHRVDIERLMHHLFATTDLERSYRVNMNVIGLNGRPQIKGLLPLLTEWLTFRKTTLKRRLQYRFNDVKKRLHILEGLLDIFLNLDEVIQIIRQSDVPKTALIEHFKLSEQQTHAILEMKLRQLGRLEQISIQSEQAELTSEYTTIERLLNSDQCLKALIKKELLEDQKRYQDSRRCLLIERPAAQIIQEEEMSTVEPITVILSKKGWIRSAKGYDVNVHTLNYKSGDSFLAKAQGRSNQLVYIIDSKGRSYALKAHTLPSARSQGEPLTKWLNSPSGAEFIAPIMPISTASWVLLACDAGYGFITEMANLYSKNRAGKALITCPARSKVLPPLLLEKKDTLYLAIITTHGHMLIFPTTSLPERSKGKGNKMIAIPKADCQSLQEYCKAITLVYEGDSLKLYAGKRHLTLKWKDLAHFQSERGRRGKKLPRGFCKVDQIDTVS